MSTHAPTLHSLADLSTDIRIAFVVGEFNHHFTRELEQVNRDFLVKNGFSDITSFLVPGAFEIPGMVGRLLETEQYDLLIALWVVVRGDTPHFDYICTESARGLMDLTLAYDTPIINGILTCNTDAQVVERISSGYALSGLNLLAEVEKITKK